MATTCSTTPTTDNTELACDCYYDTTCVIHATAIPYIGTAIDASLAKVIQALVNKIQIQQANIDSLTTRVEVLEALHP